MLALKGGLEYGSGFRALAIANNNSARMVLNHLTASVAAYLWSCAAFVVYLEYQCHRSQDTIRIRGQQPHPSRIVFINSRRRLLSVFRNIVDHLRIIWIEVVNHAAHFEARFGE